MLVLSPKGCVCPELGVLKDTTLWAHTQQTMGLLLPGAQGKVLRWEGLAGCQHEKAHFMGFLM